VTSAQNDLEEIRALENRRYQAMTDGDVGTLAELCAEDLVYTHSNAERDTKDSYLRKVRESYFVYGEISHPEERIIFAGDCAVVVGAMRADVTLQGVPRRLDNSALAVWTRSSGRWRLLAYQPTPYPAS
jgi:ketosteroid isomerase-like protein